ncbi:MAG: hypothetical protein RLO52_10805 [Sandaracinaceae bacterium]
MARAFAVLLASLLGACGGADRDLSPDDPVARDLAACRRTCPTLGIDDGARCESLCTEPCDELSATYGMAQERCEQLQAGALAPSAADEPNGAESCGDFVAFLFDCDIGRPPRDPTLDRGTQLNNELVVMQGVIANCQARRRPYDPALIACFRAASGDCARYSACADEAVAARAE